MINWPSSMYYRMVVFQIWTENTGSFELGNCVHAVWKGALSTVN